MLILIFVSALTTHNSRDSIRRVFRSLSFLVNRFRSWRWHLPMYSAFPDVQAEQEAAPETDADD